MKNIAYDAALQKLFEDFCDKKGFDKTFQEFEKFFKESVVEAIQSSYCKRYDNAEYNEVFDYLDFSKDLRTTLNDYLANFETTDDDVGATVVDNNSYVELVHYECFEQILNQIQNSNNKLELHFFAKYNKDKKEFTISPTFTINGVQRDCIDVYLNATLSAFTVPSFLSKEVFQNLIYCLKTVEQDDTKDWAIAQKSYEDDKVELSNGLHFQRIEKSLLRYYNEWFIVSNKNYERKIGSIDDKDIDFDGRFFDQEFDADKYLKKYDITENELSDIFNRANEMELDYLWDDKANGNLFDKMDKFLADNDLEDKCAVMCRKGKDFVVVALYNEQESIQSDYFDGGEIVKYDAPNRILPQCVSKICDFLVEEKQKLYENIEANVEQWVDEEYPLKNNKKVQRQ